jgi:predicted DCC family thiol-disulfide oxidoreductase YuxK
MMTDEGALGGPVLLYDGDCGFCEASAVWLRRSGGGAPEVRPWQALDPAALARLGLTREDLERAAYWVDGPELRRGHRAVAAGLVASGGWRAWCGRMIDAPGVSLVAAGVYRLVARWRHRIPIGGRACSVPPR